GVSFRSLPIRRTLQRCECGPSRINGATVATAGCDAEILTTLWTDTGTVWLTKRLHRCGHLAILPYSLRNVDRVVEGTEESFGILGRGQVRTGGHVHLLHVVFIKTDVGRISEGGEAAAAAVFEDNIGLNRHKHTVRSANEIDRAAVHRRGQFE
ncbi:MAG: hypothetical protein ABI939_09245, partial [Anaerolineaceae bacterium]